MRRCSTFAALLLLGLLFGAAEAADRLEGVWQDPSTGIAMDGFDPVAYFTQGKPVEGVPDHEFRWAGAVWRFANEGNRLAFIQGPSVYAPRFFGYDPLALASGRTVAGDPAFWAVRDRRLYLFHNRENFRQWSENARGVLAKAEANWPVLAETLPEAYRR